MGNKTCLKPPTSDATCPNIPSLLNWSFDCSDCSDWSDWSAAEFSAPTTDSIQHLAGQNSQKSVNLWDLNMFMLSIKMYQASLTAHWYGGFYPYLSFPSPIGMCWWLSPLVSWSHDRRSHHAMFAAGDVWWCLVVRQLQARLYSFITQINDRSNDRFI